jgi:hypothetical protein
MLILENGPGRIYHEKIFSPALWFKLIFRKRWRGPFLESTVSGIMRNVPKGVSMV